MKVEPIVVLIPLSSWRRYGARLLFAALAASALAACGEQNDAAPEPVAKPSEPADPGRSCSAKSPNTRCAP